MQNKILKFAGGIVLLTVVFLLGVSTGQNYQTPNTESPVQSQPEKSLSLMIDYGNGQVQTFDDLSGTTAFDVLKQASEANGVDLKYKDYGGGMGIFIESINDIGNDPTGTKWWQFWVNNKYSQTGASTYNIQPGDVIVFKFIEGQK